MNGPPAKTSTVDRWLVGAVISSAVLFLSFTAVIGSDAFWLVAMGDIILRLRDVPVGLPFATADSRGWINVPVLGELVFSAVNRLGPTGLPLAQLVADAATLGLIAVGARRLGAASRPTAAALAIIVLGALPSLGVVRAQLLSLVPFALMLLLLRSEHAEPTKRIWLLPLLLALWGNLHGAVLMGVAVSGTYLLLSRLKRDPATAVGVGIATLASIWLTPGQLQTGSYYLSVLTNEAANRRSELWAAPQLTEPFDVLLVIASVVLVAAALRRRLPGWEYLTLAGLCLATVMAARHGVWLLLFSGAIAARSWTRSERTRADDASLRPSAAVVAVSAVILLGATVATLSLREASFEAENPVIAVVAQHAHGRTVLATEPLVERLASAGVRVWASNPIDAFSRADQAAYLDFLTGAGGSSQRALDEAAVVVAPAESPASALAARAGFVTQVSVGQYLVMVRAE